jgi:hypothetical protein
MDLRRIPSGKGFVVHSLVLSEVVGCIVDLWWQKGLVCSLENRQKDSARV